MSLAIVCNSIKSHLKEYLEELELWSPGQVKIVCLNPEHEDHDPSMHVYDKNVYCYTCGASYNIFEVAELTEGKPNGGPEFVYQTVKYFADKYKIEFDPGKISQKEIYIHRAKQAYNDAQSIIVSSELSKTVLDEIERRKWTTELCTKLGIGSVESFENFKELLLEKYEENFLKEIGLLPLEDKGSESFLFENTSLIFPIKDRWGSTIGFTARTNTKPKYINTRGTILFQKGKEFFGLHRYLNLCKDKPVYIFEGPSNCVTAINDGIDNCIACCGTALTDEHLSLLTDLDIRDVILCFDGDQPGQTRALKLVDEKLLKLPLLRPKLISLPEGHDPDSLIRERGVDAFLQLAKHSAFKWRLLQFEDPIDPVEVVSKSIPLIGKEQTATRKEQMVRELSEVSGISIESLKEDLQNYIDNLDQQDQEKKKAIALDIARLIEKDPGGIERILINGMDRISESVPKGVEILGAASFQEEILQIRDKALSGEQPPVLRLGELSPFFEKFDFIYGGFTIYVGGKPNHGKSALCSQIALELATMNEDILVLYLTIDDNMTAAVPRCVTFLGKDEALRDDIRLTINKVRYPIYHVTGFGADNQEKLYKAVSYGYDRLLNLAKSGRLIIKDQASGRSLTFLDRWVKHWRDKYPDKRIFLIVDNFHNIKDESNSSDSAQVIKKRSDYIKRDIAERYNVFTICTIEYTKIAAMQKPSNNNIADSRGPQYDGSAIIHVYSSLADYKSAGREDDCDIYWMDPRGVKMPKIELIFGKSKISDFTGSMYYNLTGDQNCLEHTLITTPEMKAGQDSSTMRQKWTNPSAISVEV